MATRQSSYNYEEILSCGRGELFGPGNAQLPLPPMLMVHRITEISEASIKLKEITQDAGGNWEEKEQVLLLQEEAEVKK